METLIYLMNVNFDRQMREAGMEYEYLPRACGVHDRFAWEADTARWLPALIDTFASPPPPPAMFDYRTAEPAVSVWEWSFSVDRPAVELLDLRAASPTGLTLTGSGSVDVLTAPVFEPGRSYTLTTARAGVVSFPIGVLPKLGSGDAGPATQSTVTADDAGRSAFTVDLGPAHIANQFSPEGIVAEASAPGEYYRTATVTIAAAAVPSRLTDRGGLGFLGEASIELLLVADPPDHTRVRRLAEALPAVMGFVQYFGTLIEQRRTDPRDDLLSNLISAEADGDALTHQELFAMIILLFIAGHETTTNLIGNGRHHPPRALPVLR